MKRMMRDLVEVQGGFKPSVRLPEDFFDEELNRHFVKSYIPTPEILDIFMDVRDSLQPNSERRAKVFASTFGTGKSDLMLMIANYVTRQPDDPLLAPFFTRLRRLNHAKAEAIYQARKQKPSFLLVLLQADVAITFSSFVLNGLAESLQKAGLSHLLGTTYYQAALDLIDLWQNKLPDNIKRLEDVLAREYGRTLNQLKYDLVGPLADSALSIFRQAVSTAIGMEFQPNTVIKMPYQAFDEVAKQLVASGQYSGIFVIADEFTHLLEKLAHSPTAGDSKAIDNLAEAADRSGPNQLHFYIVSLYAFASMKGSTQLAQAALERSGGRFSQHGLLSQNTEELISASITKLVPTERLLEGAPGQEDGLLSLATRLWGGRATGRIDQQWLRDTVVRGCFPLHPLATYCLRPLNLVLAQNERTMFSFIWDHENGLNPFIQQTSAEVSNGRIKLLSLVKLFNYFNLSIKEKRPELWQVYQDAATLLSPEQFHPGLEGQLLRALILLEVTSGDPNLRADKELLRHALNLPPSSLPEITVALQQLQEHDIAYPSQSGHYQLVKEGRAKPSELRRRIEKRVRELPGSPLEQLNGNVRYQPLNVEARAYNSERGTARKLISRFVSPAGLSNPATLSDALPEQDGLLCYVVAASEEELAQARSVARKLTKQHKQLIVALPSHPTDLLMRWKYKQALEELRKEANYQTPEYQDLLVDKGLVGKDYLDAFKQARKFFDKPANFEWLRGGRIVQVTKKNDVNRLAVTVMNDLFPATPAHNTPQHLTSSRNTKNRKDALDDILQAPFKLKKKGKPAKKAILLDGAGELGLVYSVRSEGGYEVYDVSQPDHKRSLAVWNLLDHELQQATPVSEVVEKLLSPPYGLYTPVLQLFVAAFYRLNRDHIEVYKATDRQKRPLDITSNEIIDLIDDPKQYIVRYQPLTERQRQFLHELERALPASSQKSAPLRNRVAKSLRQLARKKVPLVARQASAGELAIVLSDVPHETLVAGAALVKAGHLSSEAKTVKALFETLSADLGLPADHTEWTDTSLQPLQITVPEACQALEHFSQRFNAYLAGQIGQQFGLTAPPINPDESLNAALEWRQQFSLRAGDLAESPDAEYLLRILDNNPENFEDMFLNKLPDRWQLGVVKKWRQLGNCDEYLKRLQEAKTVIESKALEVEAQRQPTAPDPAPDDSIADPSSAATDSDTQKTVRKPTRTGTLLDKLPNYKIRKATTVVADPPAPISFASDEVNPVDEAFTKIEAIFSPLSPEEQDALLGRLNKEYDRR